MNIIKTIDYNLNNLELDYLSINWADCSLAIESNEIIDNKIELIIFNLIHNKKIKTKICTIKIGAIDIKEIIIDNLIAVSKYHEYNDKYIYCFYCEIKNINNKEYFEFDDDFNTLEKNYYNYRKVKMEQSEKIIYENKKLIKKLDKEFI